MEAVLKNIGIMAVFVLFLMSINRWVDLRHDKKSTLASIQIATENGSENLPNLQQLYVDEKVALAQWRIVAVATGGILAWAYKAGHIFQ